MRASIGTKIKVGDVSFGIAAFARSPESSDTGVIHRIIHESGGCFLKAWHIFVV
jgi:hypothetical protein